MASAFRRGTKAAPRWFARFKDESGRWRARVTDQPSRALAMAVARELAARAERRRLGLERDPAPASPLCGPLLKTWSLSLTNRSYRDDIGRLEKHLLPRFEVLRLDQVTLAEVMRWLDDMKAAAEIGPGTQRHCLNLLSRFLSWAIERGHPVANVVRSIPSGRRPQATGKPAEVPWIDSDTTVAAIMAALPEAIGLMFYVGNRSGLRLGEICGLRMSDVADLARGSIRVRYSYKGPLKEDRRGAGKMKFAPAASDAGDVLGPWLARRRADGAGAEDFVFLAPGGGHFTREQVTRAWHPVRRALGLGSMTFYMATRHSACSRWLSNGVPLDDAAAALGHSTPSVTARHYAHFVRKEFGPGMTAPIAPLAKVIPMAAA